MPEYRFLVEVIFEKLEIINNGGEDMYFQPDISLTSWEFMSEERDEALKNAELFVNKILSEGLELKGDAVLRSIIPPSCIKQVGLVDLQLAVPNNEPPSEGL